MQNGRAKAYISSWAVALRARCMMVENRREKGYHMPRHMETAQNCSVIASMRNYSKAV